MTTPTPPLRTYEEALQGTRGVDFFPEEACDICGGIVYLSGARYVMHHDAVKHDITATPTVGTDARAVAKAEHSMKQIVDRIHDRAVSVRRSTGERDE